MLFNSHQFIFVFMPVVLAGYWGLGRVLGQRWGFRWLLAASLFFYWQLSGSYILVLLFSIGMNYAFAGALFHAAPGTRRRGLIAAASIAANLLLLGYFKYLGFILDNLDLLLGTSAHVAPMLLPIGLSFFTFQQIAYLVDVNAEQARPAALFDYALFVSFFGHVTAGPIVHHSEVLPLYAGEERALAFRKLFLPALVIFSIGLFKKVVIADNLAAIADRVFLLADGRQAITVADAWFGAVTYTLQLYFDFSGYSDMAIGVGLLFGITLPINFDSPYKARSIIEFWQRWHISLTRFFTTYVYLPLAMLLHRKTGTMELGAAQRFAARVAVPTLVTFLLAGFWHGAGWNYGLFGLLHGGALTINQGWRAAGLAALPAPLGWLLTAVVILIGMTLFRASDTVAALIVIGGLAGIGTAPGPALDVHLLALVSGLMAIVLFAPNSQQISGHFDAAVARGRDSALRHPEAVRLVFTSVVFWVAVMSIVQQSHFLYYQY
jgi:D-alanyl-lipoteichoic acid acyltransferase DltB (MBOAT superfamily)